MWLRKCALFNPLVEEGRVEVERAGGGAEQMRRTGEQKHLLPIIGDRRYGNQRESTGYRGNLLMWSLNHNYYIGLQLKNSRKGIKHYLEILGIPVPTERPPNSKGHRRLH